MAHSDSAPRPRRRLLLERLEDRILFDGVAVSPDALQPEPAASNEVVQTADYELAAKDSGTPSSEMASSEMASSEMTARDSQQFETNLIASIEATEALLESELAASQSFVDGLSESQGVATAAIEDSIITQVENAVVVPDDPMTRREIVFISTDVYDYEYLSLNLPESAQIALITSDRDGMEQIAEALRGESNVDAIHIISHGRAGELFLGSAAVNTASLSNEYADELAIIRAALSDDADVLVYGCSVANGDIGQNFIDALAVASGADVAASTNDTGSEAKGGDWNLEASVGLITTQSIQATSWDGLLAPISITPVTGTATAAGTTLATNILGNGITLNSATFSGDNSQAGTFTSATGYTPEWLGYGSGILLSTGNTSQVIGPNTSEGSSVDAPGGFTDADLGLLGQGTSFDAASLTLTFTPTSNRVTLQFTFGSDEYNEYVYSAFNDAMGIWVNGQQMAILPSGETISVNSVNQAATFNPANGNQIRDPFPGNGTFDSASPSLYKSNSVASGTYNTGMDGFTVTMSIIADVTAGVTNTIKIGITDIQDASWDSWLFIRSASFEAETIAYTDNVTTNVNTPVTINALANDWDMQGDALTITHIADIPVTAGGSPVTLGSGATAQLTATGQILYTPLTGSTQNDIFTYTIQDTTGTTAVGFINVAIPAPPTVDLNDNGTTTDRNNAVTYGLNSAAVAVATSTASVSDVNDPTYPLLTLGLGGFVDGSSEIVNIGGTDFAYGTAQTSNITVSGTAITVTYNGANSITVARTASGAEISDALMETIIRGVTYRNTATNGTFGDRTINFTVNDGTSNSNTATATISVVNAVPVVDLNDNGTTAARDNSVTFTEGNSPVNIATSTASVIDSNDLTYPSLAITLGGFVGGSSERISIGGTEFTYGTTLTTTVTVGSTTFRVAYNGANGIAITNNASGVEMPDADVETLIRGITYRHLPGVVTSGARSMSFAVNDGNVDSNTAVATINVVGTPMAPTIDLNGNDVGATGNFRDTFESVAYNRNDGTLNWSTDWIEGPSATSASAGDIRIVADGTANVLRLGDDSATGQADTIRRSANLSAYTSAVLSFDYRRVALDDNINDYIVIEASFDGTTFTQVGRIEGPTNDATYQSFSVNISAYISANTTIRFTAPNSLGGTDFVLIDNVNIAVTAPAPTSHSASYQIGNAPVRISSTTGTGVVVTDVNENITQAVVTLTNPQTGDALSVAGTLPSGITAVVSGGGSVVTLSGYGSPAMYKQAIEAIGFANSNQSASLINRTITVQLTDSTAFTSNTATATITMIGNAAPTIDLDGGTAGNNFSTTYTEDGAAAPVVNTSAVITDTDDANMESATVILTNAFAGDVLSFGTLPAGIVGSVNTSIPGQITVTLTGSATKADYITALRAIAYSTTSNTPNTTTRTINVTVNDGAANSNTATTSITIAANNDAPTTTDDSVTTPEDTTIVLGLSDFGTYSDPEGTAIASVRITSLPAAGALQFFNGTAWVGVTTSQNITAANITAGNVRFVPTANQNGSPYTTIGFQVSDGSLFSATSTLTVNVTPVNDAPTSTALANRSNVDGATVSINVSGSFSDIDAGDTLTFSASGLPAGLSINPTTGIISGTIASNASVTGPYFVTITATDSGSATTSQAFTWTVTNPAPTAVADNGATTENATTSGNVITNDTDPDGDTLTVASVNGSGTNVGNAVAGSNGGTFTIGSNGAYTFNPGTAFDNLAAGQTRATNVTYVVTDNQGGSSSTTLTITVTGTNDAPTSTAIANQTSTDAAVVSLNVAGNFNDPDTMNTLTYSASGLPSGLSINATTGIISGTIANNASVSGPYTVVVTATDNASATTSQSFTWTVTNPAPTATNDAGATTENANTSGNVLTNDTDPDGDTLTVSAVNGNGTSVGSAVTGTNGGTFTIGSNGAYTFDPGTAFDNLALGATRTTGVNYTVIDGQGGISTATLIVTVIGTNNAPTSTSIANQSSVDGAAVSLNVAGQFSDVDATDALTFSASGLPNGLSINAATGLISGTIANNASVSGPYSVTVTATDSNGSSTSQNLTWIVTNPAPTAVANTLAVNENSTGTINVLTNDTDPDNDTLSVSAVNGLAGNVGSSVAGSDGGTFVISSTGTLTFNPGTAFDDLALGETRTTTVTYTASDNQGGTSTATVTVTVTGLNDAPTSTTIAGQSSNDASSVTLNVAPFFADLDASEALSFTVSGLPNGLSINATTGVISGTIAANASVSGPYSVTVTGTDPHGASTSQTFVWTVLNPAPTAVADTNATTENATISGNVIANDTDPDGDTLTVAAVNGLAGNVATAVAGTNGGTFTIGSNGAYAFNPGTAFDDLAVGQTRATSVTYSATDNQGGASSTTLTITVTGTNDGPTSTALSNRTNADGSAVSVNVSGNFADADATDTLTFSASGLPAGLSIHPTTGIISGTIANNASVSGPFTVMITATDPHGLATSQSFTWSVTNPAPAATADAGSTSETSTTSGNVISNDTDPDNDVLTVAAVNGNGASVGNIVTGTNGGSFTINSDGTYTFNPGASFDDLAVGESRSTSVTYTATDSQGGNSSTTLTITVNGTNDAPVSTAIANQSSSDGQTISLSIAGNFSDPDTSDVLAFTASGLPSGLSINSSTGVISGTIANNASVSGPFSVTITATDPHGLTTSRTLTWAVSNPAPTANPDAAATTENANTSGNVLTNDTDPDNDILSVAAVNGSGANVGSAITGSNGGSFTIASNGSYTFNPGTAFDDLAAGETRTTSVTYTATDSQGGTSSSTLTVTVTGTNDAPTSTVISNQTNADGASVTLNVAGNFSDADASNTLTFSATGLPSGLSINSTTGIITGTIANNASVTGPYSVTVTATDNANATTSRTFTWTVTNPAPTATNDSGATTENAATSGNALSNDTDPDNDTLTVLAVNGVAGNVAGSVAGSNGGTFTVNANGTYSFTPGTAFDDLAAGETRTTNVQYTVTDSQGGTSTATLTVTVTGTNDAPTSTSIANQSNVDGSTVSLNVAGQFSDLDATNTLTYSASGLPGGLSINATTGLISGTIANNASVTGPYSVTVTATDNASATTSQTFTWTVTNPAPTATNDTATIASNATASGNVLTNDTDPDNDSLSVSSVNGSPANVGTSVSGSNGGTFSIAADGAFTFNPGADFDSLGAGATATTTVTYQMTDSQGGFSTATVTITVTGINSAPASTPIAAQSSIDGGSVTLNVSGNFSDPDAGDALTFSASSLPPGLSINSATGIISGTIDNNASVGGPYSVTITATDIDGATTSQTFTWTVTNPTPVATNDATATTENTSSSGNVLTNDSDPDGDTLTVSAVNGVAGNVGNGVVGSNGGTFTINATGGYTFVPGTSFDDLAAGDTRTTSVTYTISDGNGGTSTATVTATVTGTNDAPTSTAIANQTSTDAAVVSLNVASHFSDVDATNVLTFSASGLPSGLSINASTGLISGTIASNASVTGPYSVTVTATDNAGATTSRTFTWTVTNPAPTAVADTGTTTENGNASGNVITNDTDPDNDTLTVSAVNGVAGNVGTNIAGSNGGTFTISSTGAYTFNPGAAFDDLAVGQTRTTTVNYTVSDNQGGISTATVIVTVTGTNDGPTAVGTIAGQSNVDSASVSLNVSGFFADADTTDVLSFSASGLPTGLSINATTGIISGTINSSASASGPFSVVVTANDGNGGTVNQSFTWIVTNPAPIANNDSFAIGEDAASTVVGNALTNDSDPDGDAFSATVQTNVAGSNGGVFSIAENGNVTFEPNGAFNNLAAGQTRTTTLNYVITDANGATSSATITVTVNGANDAPTSTPIANQTSTDASVVSLNVSGNFSDPDTTNTLSYSASGLPSGLSINTTTGLISGTIANNASVSGPYSVTVTATDNAGATTSQSFTWTVTNPAPTAVSDTGATTENATTSGNVITNDTDPDNDTLTVSAVNGVGANVGGPVTGTNGGTFTIGSDGAYSFSPGTAFDDLAVGQTRTTSVTYTATDSQGGSSSTTLTITVTGTNDAPVSTALSNRMNADGSTVSVNVSGNFSDPDATDTLTFSASGLPAGLSINPTSGIISGTIASNASVSGPFSVSVTATDPHGATTTRNFTWTVTNPAPTAIADTGATTENANATGNVLTNDTDPDNDTLTVATVNGSGTNVGIAIAGTNGGTFTIDANGDYSFNPGTAFDDLAFGQSRSTSVTYTATDSQGGASSTTLTITVNGTNDAPTSTSIANQSSSDAASVTLNVSGNFADVDAGSVLAYSASGLPSGLTINASTGIISGTIANNASVTSPYSVTVTATDAHGATTSQNFSWTVTNPAPTAVSNSVATTENSSTSGNVLTNDTDPDNDTLSVSAVNGVAGGVNSNVAGIAGGTFVIASNGAFTFNPGTAFDDLAFGETRTTSVNYTATDSQGGSSTTTLTVTVTGTNDAPTSTAIGNQSSVDAANVTLDVSSFFDDLDATDVLTYSASGLPNGLSINAATGIITGTIANNASVTGPYSVEVIATDSQGATTTQTLTWAVTNPGPSATADSNTTTENSIVSGNVLTNDTDPDNDVLTVSAVNGSGTNVGTSVTGSNGGTFTIASNGAYSFNPGTAFDDLALGETRTTTVQYTTTDSQGGFSTTTVTIEVDGQNDGPTSTAIGNRTSVDGATVSLNVRSRFSDVDATDVLTFAASGLPTGLSINATTGVISGTIANNASVTAPYSVTVTATDGSGENTSRIFTWNVTNPTPTASNDSATVAINTTGSGNVLTNDTDPDNDALTVVSVNGSGSSVGSNVAGTTGGTFTVLANGNYSFDPGVDFDSLAAGESRTTSITYTMSDSQGGSSTATVTVTVTGLNASPVGTAIANQTSSDAASVSLNVAGNFSDPNASDVLTFAASGLPSGLSINATTGLISGTIANNASLSGPYSVTITATDNHGASTSQSFTWTVTNPAPTATNDSRTTAENSAASGNVLTNDTDPDNDVLTVAAVNGVAGNVGNSVTGSSGGSFTIESNGSYTFNPGTAFDDLAVGQTRTTSVTYLVTDSQGGSSSAVLVVTVVGANDAPTSTAIAAQTSADAQAVSLNVAGSFSDPDTTDTLTFAASGLPSGLSINTTTGLISGTIANNASVTSPYSVTVTATDNHGATTSQTFAWTVTNPGPTAVADTGTAVENGSVTGNVLTNDTDPDNDVLTVATVNGSGVNVGTSVAGTNGGSFTITNTGGYSFNPGTAFDDLAVGQSRTTSVTYSATDSQGGSSSTTLTITVTGTNDGPVSSSLANRSNADGSTVSVNVAGNFSDPDNSDALTFAASGLPTGLAINPTTGLISGTIANNASVTGPYNVVVTATDPHGATTTQSFVWTVTNPAPTANNDGGATTENSNASGNVLTNDTDPDNDILTVAAVNGVSGNVAGAVAGSNGGTFTINANGTYSFVPGTAFDNLAAGETRTTSVQYTATDSQGGTSTATLTVTVTGANDAPTSTAIANQTSVDGASVLLNVAGQFGDVDASNVLTFSASGLPSGLSINSATGLITGTIANNASVSGPYSVTVTATDNAGATTSQTFNWIVTNPAPTAVNDSATIASDGTASGNVLTNDTDPDNDALSVSAVNGNGANVGSSIAGTNGGSFSIGTNGAWTFDPGTDFDSLGAGQSRTSSITYTMTDSQGGSSTATVTVTVTGLNSAPTSTPIANQTGVDAGSVTLNVSGNFSDPDSGDTLTFSASGLPSGLSINPTTGMISGTIASNASVSGPYFVTITATDSGNATTSQSFIWTVTNPAPTAANDSRTTTENSMISGNVLTNDTDPDNDTLTVSAVNGLGANVGNALAGSNGGTFTIGSNGAYSFNPGTAFDNLAVGQTRTTSVTYTATDSQGGTSTATLTITVTGTNDGPVSTVISNQSSSDGSSVTVNVSGNFSDPDTGDVLTYSASGLPSGLSIHPSTGIISGTIANNASVSGPFAVSVTATDPHGATTTRNFTWTVTNPAPTAVADARTTGENISTSGNVLTNDTDPDNDVLTVSAVNGTGTNVGAAVTGTNGGSFTIGSTGAYTFNPGSAFDDLAVGQTRTTSVTYTTTDSQGGTSSTTLTITVTGANDGPTSTPIAAQSSADAQSVSLNVSGHFTDPDAGAVFAYSANGLPSGLSINPTTGIISGTIASNASVTGPYSVTVTATDEHGSSTSQTFAWAVSNPGPTAVADTRTTSENTSTSGNVLTNDTDPDSDTLSVASVNGVTTNVGAAVAGSNGGTFVINSNGSYTFNPGTAFNDLAVGQARTSSVTYTATDSQGGTSSTTLTITVTGSNDAPVSTAISTQNSSDGSPVVLNVGGNFTDPDTTDPLTFSAAGLPSGLSIHPTTGVISGTIAHNASVSGPYSVVVTAADPHGGTTSQTFVWNVTNPAPTANNDAATVNENSTSSGNVLSNDTDPDGDTLTVQSVNGSNSNVSNAVAGSNGGTFTIQPNGSYVFNPGSSFDDLAVGETRTSSVTYTMTDNQGGTSTATVTVTVTGLNDAPTSTPIATQNGIDNTPVTLDVSTSFGDPDASDPLTFSAGNLPPGLTIDPLTGLIHGTINSSASVTGPYSVTVTATDPHGATTSRTFTWNVANPAPTAPNDLATTPENSSITGNVLTNDTDPDNDALVVSSVNGSSSNLGRPFSGTTGGTFVIQSNGGYSFNPGTSFDHLGVGQSVITSVTYMVSDGQGGTSTATVSVTVTGTNDTPIAAAIPAQDSTGRDVINLDVSSFFSDAETHEPLTFSASNLPPGLSINPTTGLITGSIDPNAASTGPYSVTVTGTDIHGASVTTSFQWNVENPDLMVLVNDSVPSVNAGDTVVFSVNYANISNRDASGVVITQTLPAHTTFNSAASTAGWINNGDGTYSYALGNVDAHEDGTILFAVTVADTLPSGIDQTSTSSTIADDGSHGNDLTPFNNIASDVTSIDARPDYRITIDDSKVLVYRGETLSYNIHVSNSGSQNGTGVVVTSYFPPEVLGSVTVSHGGVINTLAGTITWNLGTLSAGSDVNLSVSAVIPLNAPASILNFAQYVTVTDDGSNGADRTPLNNAATDSNFLMSFGFDSFGNRSQEGFGMIPPSAPPLTTRLMPLAVDPIFSGITEPGTTLVGKIYDQHGNLIGERQVMADSSGNWMMSFPNSIVMENPHRMEVQQTAAIQSGVQSGFNFRRYFHPTAHSSIFFSTELSVNEVFRRSAYQMIDQLHEGNESPYGFNWYALAYELAMASSNAGEG